MNGSISISVIDLLLWAAIVALMVYGFRHSPGGWLGLILRAVLGFLTAAIVGMVCWNVMAVLASR